MLVLGKLSHVPLWSRGRRAGCLPVIDPNVHPVFRQLCRSCSASALTADLFLLLNLPGKQFVLPLRGQVGILSLIMLQIRLKVSEECDVPPQAVSPVAWAPARSAHLLLRRWCPPQSPAATVSSSLLPVVWLHSLLLHRLCFSVDLTCKLVSCSWEHGFSPILQVSSHDHIGVSFLCLAMSDLT